MAGDCFEVAVERIIQLRHHDLEAFVCHGTPLGRGPINGKRYWHAWVEWRPIGGPWLVMDNSNGLTIVGMKRSDYYAKGFLLNTEILRFTLAECRAEMQSRGHWGPWRDGWESMVDIT